MSPGRKGFWLVLTSLHSEIDMSFHSIVVINKGEEKYFMHVDVAVRKILLKVECNLKALFEWIKWVVIKMNKLKFSL